MIMSHKVKAGSYWRRLVGHYDSTRIFKALEDGWSNMPILFEVVGDIKNVTTTQIIANDALYRCKKNGEWFGANRTEAQRENMKWLSLAWQAKGALASLERVLAYQMDEPALQAMLRDLKLSMLARLEAARKDNVRRLQKKENRA